MKTEKNVMARKRKKMAASGEAGDVRVVNRLIARLTRGPPS